MNMQEIEYRETIQEYNEIRAKLVKLAERWWKALGHTGFQTPTVTRVAEDVLFNDFKDKGMVYFQVLPTSFQVLPTSSGMSSGGSMPLKYLFDDSTLESDAKAIISKSEKEHAAKLAEIIEIRERNKIDLNRLSLLEAQTSYVKHHNYGQTNLYNSTGFVNFVPLDLPIV